MAGCWSRHVSIWSQNSPIPLIRLCPRNLLSKMPVRTVGSQGLIPRGTFREHFTFHSWQAEMGCQTALREKPTRRHALHRSRL